MTADRTPGVAAASAGWQDHPLADLAAGNPAWARVLDRYGLDYCCRGERTLAAACAQAGLDVEAVAAELAATEPEGPASTGDDPGWTRLDAVALARHIVDTHHRYLDAELEPLQDLAAKVREVHGERHPELASIAAVLTALREDLVPHLRKEERILFPAIEAAAAGRREFPFGPIGNPIRVMRAEHDRAGDLLAELRRLSGGYRVPDDACASYRSLYARLEQLEHDTHLHILKENHRLFPLAEALTAGPG